MKTKLNLVFALLLSAVLSITTLNAQEAKTDYGMAEVTYMMPKTGMEKAFEDAVKAHNEKYHKEGPYKANLDYILTGKETGWYVWVMGPCTFTDLDSRPNDDAHRMDWDKNVSPKVYKYGRNEYWRYNDKLSYRGDASDNAKLENLWFLDIADGKGDEFRGFMEKVKKAYEKKGKGHFMLYFNQFSEDNGRDAAIVWTMDKWGEMDMDDGGIKDSYEEIYGEGSWEKALDVWRSAVTSVKSQMWKIGVN